MTQPAPILPLSPAPLKPVYRAPDMFGGPDHIIDPNQPARRPIPRTRSGTRILSAEEWDQFMRRKWLGVADAAAVLGVSDEQVYHWLQDGELEAMVKSRQVGPERNYYNIETAEIRRFLDARKLSATVRAQF